MSDFGSEAMRPFHKFTVDHSAAANSGSQHYPKHSSIPAPGAVHRFSQRRTIRIVGETHLASE